MDYKMRLGRLLPFKEGTTRILVKLDHKALQKFAGTYEFDLTGAIDIIEGSKLDLMDRSIAFRPEDGVFRSVGDSRSFRSDRYLNRMRVMSFELHDDVLELLTSESIDSFPSNDPKLGDIVYLLDGEGCR